MGFRVLNQLKNNKDKDQNTPLNMEQPSSNGEEFGSLRAEYPDEGEYRIGNYVRIPKQYVSDPIGSLLGTAQTPEERIRGEENRKANLFAAQGDRIIDLDKAKQYQKDYLNQVSRTGQLYPENKSSIGQGRADVDDSLVAPDMLLAGAVAPGIAKNGPRFARATGESFDRIVASNQRGTLGDINEKKYTSYLAGLNKNNELPDVIQAFKQDPHLITGGSDIDAKIANMTYDEIMKGNDYAVLNAIKKDNDKLVNSSGGKIIRASELGNQPEYQQFLKKELNDLDAYGLFNPNNKQIKIADRSDFDKNASKMENAIKEIATENHEVEHFKNKQILKAPNPVNQADISYEKINEFKNHFQKYNNPEGLKAVDELMSDVQKFKKLQNDLSKDGKIPSDVRPLLDDAYKEMTEDFFNKMYDFEKNITDPNEFIDFSKANNYTHFFDRTPNGVLVPTPQREIRTVLKPIVPHMPSFTPQEFKVIKTLNDPVINKLVEDNLKTRGMKTKVTKKIKDRW